MDSALRNHCASWYFLAVDPGVRVLGWALFDRGSLTAAGLSEVDEGDPALSAPLHKDQIMRSIAERRYYWPDVRVCERMVVRGAHSKEDPSDLLNVQLVSGFLGTHWLTPQEWKGSVSRQTEQNRTRSRLTTPELVFLTQTVSHMSRKALAHNMLSAVGIGLKVLERKSLK